MTTATDRHHARSRAPSAPRTPASRACAKVTGAARYAGEIPFAELAHGWLVLSTIARGRIRSVEDRARPRRCPACSPSCTTGTPRASTPTTSGLLGQPDPTAAASSSTTGCRTSGWPVALVVAETSEQAREAAEALVVTYDEEPHDVAFSAGTHPDAYTPEGPPAATEKGDVEAELAASAVVRGRGVHHARKSTTTRWSRTRRRRAGRAAGWRSSTPTRAPSWVAQRAGAAVLPRPGLGAGAVRARRRRLRRPRASAPTRCAAVMAATVLAPPGPGRPDPPSDVLAGRLPQPAPRSGSGSAPTPTGGCARSTTRRLSLTSTDPRVRRAERRARPRRCTTPTRTARANRVVRLDVPTPTCMRAPGEAPGSFALESALDELAEKCGLDPIDAARTQRTRGRARLRAAVQQPQPARPASRRARAGSAGRTATRAPACAATGAGCSAPARRRPRSRRAPCRPRRP